MSVIGRPLEEASFLLACRMLAEPADNPDAAAQTIATQRALSLEDAMGLRCFAQQFGTAHTPDETQQMATEALNEIATELDREVSDLKSLLYTRLGEAAERGSPDESVIAASPTPAVLENADLVEAALGSISAIVGHREAKVAIARWAQRIQFDRARGKDGTPPRIVLEGEDGVGKKTLLEAAATLAQGLGVLKSAKLVSIEPNSDRLQQVVEEAAKNGQGLSIANADAFRGSRRAPRTLQKLKSLLDTHPNVGVFVSGSPDAIRALLLEAGGLADYFPTKAHLGHLSDGELELLTRRLLQDESLELGPGALDAIRRTLSQIVRGSDFGNARTMRRIVDGWIDNLASRHAARPDQQATSTLFPPDITLPDDVPAVGFQLRGVASTLDIVAILDRGLVGHPHVKEAFARCVFNRLQSRIAVQGNQPPVGVHVLWGPSGCGKSQAAYALADGCYGGRIVEINGNDLVEEHVCEARLKGAAPGYKGFGEFRDLAQKIREHSGHCVVLIDEANQAHPTLFTLLMEINQKGKFDDHLGNPVDCRHIEIVMTGNWESLEKVAASMKSWGVGRLSEDPLEMQPLSEAEQRVLFDRDVARLVGKEMRARGFEFIVDDSARQLIIEAAKKLDLGERGARPIQRAIERYLKVPLLENLALAEDAYGAPPAIIEAHAIEALDLGRRDEGAGDRLNIGFRRLDSAQLAPGQEVDTQVRALAASVGTPGPPPKPAADRLQSARFEAAVSGAHAAMHAIYSAQTRDEAKQYVQQLLEFIALIVRTVGTIKEPDLAVAAVRAMCPYVLTLRDPWALAQATETINRLYQGRPSTIDSVLETICIDARTSNHHRRKSRESPWIVATSLAAAAAELLPIPERMGALRQLTSPTTGTPWTPCLRLGQALLGALQEATNDDQLAALRGLVGQDETRLLLAEAAANTNLRDDQILPVVTILGNAGTNPRDPRRYAFFGRHRPEALRSDADKNFAAVAQLELFPTSNSAARTAFERLNATLTLEGDVTNECVSIRPTTRGSDKIEILFSDAFPERGARAWFVVEVGGTPKHLFRMSIGQGMTQGSKRADRNDQIPDGATFRLIAIVEGSWTEGGIHSDVPIGKGYALTKRINIPT